MHRLAQALFCDASVAGSTVLAPFALCSFAYVAHFAFLRDVWIRTLRGAVASRRASNLATHLPAELLGHPCSSR